jgi:membrane protein
MGILVALWSANGGTKAMFDSLNVVYEEHEKRGYIRRTLVSLAVTLGTLVFVMVVMAAVVALPIALNFVGLGKVTDLLLRVGRWPLLLVIITVMLAVIYRYGPSRTEARWRWVSWGGAFAAIAWVLVSLAFSWYVAHFGSYNKTYGSLGAAIGFMTWIWISATIALIGAELNAEMEHQTTRDTTTGAEKPLGARGANKADTVAPI